MEKRLAITADFSERRSGIIEALEKHPRIDVRLNRLEVGDYLLSDRCGVERKTAPDFAASIKTKRLFRQLIDLKSNFERPLFLIEGYHLYQVRGVHPSGIRGALSMIAITHGIPILFSKDREDTVEFLVTIARQEQVLQREVTLYPKRKALTPSDELERILDSFPGIGPSLSRELLTRYRTIGEILAASPRDLKKVPRIGEKKAQKIKEILRRTYNPEEEDQ